MTELGATAFGRRRTSASIVAMMDAIASRSPRRSPGIQRRWAILSLLVVSFMGVLHADEPSSAPSDTKPMHWRVVWTKDPATSATVSWSTKKPPQKNVLLVGPRGGELRPVAVTRSGIHTDELGRFELAYHHVELADLKPETAYDIQMESDGRRSPRFYFVTAPRDDRPLSLLFGGDSRTGIASRRAINQMIAELFGKGSTGEEPADEILALVHGGDFIVNGRNLEEWSDWLSDHELTAASDGRLLPIIPARGNHDGGKPFNEVFNFPEDDRNFYALDIGSQIRLVTLNSETSIAGDQAAWLGKELAASRPTHRWLLAQYHRPAFPAVKSPGESLRYWVPLFEKHNVDLVCEADGHVIKRTVPIRNDKHDPTGVVYIGEGGLGVPQRTPKSDRWYLQPPGMTSSGHHVQRLRFTRDELRYECIALGGKTLDTYTMSPRRREAQ